MLRRCWSFSFSYTAREHNNSIISVFHFCIRQAPALTDASSEMNDVFFYHPMRYNSTEILNWRRTRTTIIKKYENFTAFHYRHLQNDPAHHLHFKVRMTLILSKIYIQIWTKEIGMCASEWTIETLRINTGSYRCCNVIEEWNSYLYANIPILHTTDWNSVFASISRYGMQPRGRLILLLSIQFYPDWEQTALDSFLNT